MWYEDVVKRFIFRFSFLWTSLSSLVQLLQKKLSLECIKILEKFIGRCSLVCDSDMRWLLYIYFTHVWRSSMRWKYAGG